MSTVGGAGEGLGEWGKLLGRKRQAGERGRLVWQESTGWVAKDEMPVNFCLSIAVYLISRVICVHYSQFVEYRKL